jgi:CheY-like chemotaxis protein
VIPSRQLVLVVDDDEEIRQPLADLLSAEGYDVLTAGNGVEALEKLRQTPRPHPCLILLDLRMPIMNGQEFFDAKQLDPELVSIAVVVMSAEGNLDLKAIPFGGEYLAKPARSEAILGVVARHCEIGPLPMVGVPKPGVPVVTPQ